MPGAPQPFVPGPTKMYVGLGGGGALQFLGWSENGWTKSPTMAFEDVMSDVSGTRMAFDIQPMGEDCIVSGVTTVFNIDTLVNLKARGVGRSMGSGTIGDLFRLSGEAFQMVLFCPYGAGTNPNALSAPYPNGYNFPACTVVDAIDEPLSTKATRIRFTIRALPVWNIQNYTYTTYSLYSGGDLGI